MMDKDKLMVENEVLIKCVKIPHTQVMCDSFIEDDQLNIIIEHTKSKESTLRNTVLALGKTYLSEKETKKVL